MPKGVRGFQKGNTLGANNKGKHRTDEEKLKMSLIMIGNTNGYKKGNTLGFQKGNTLGFKKGNTKWLGNIGLKRSDATKLKMGGKNSHFWKGGIAHKNDKIRNSMEYINWRKAVFEKDDYTCQNCRENKGGNLNAHHIKSFVDYPELRLEISNGLTLCKKCHRQNGYHKK